MRRVGYHSKTWLHRNKAQARLWLARLDFKNNKRDNKDLNNRGNSLFFLINIFYTQSSEVFCQKGVLKISQNLQQNTRACGVQLYWKWDSFTGVWENLIMTAFGFIIQNFLLICATQWTNRNQMFSILEHVLSQVLNVINIMNFAFGKLHFLVRKITT